MTKQANTENQIKRTALVRSVILNIIGDLNQLNLIPTSPSASVLVQLYTFMNKKIMKNMFEDIKHKYHTLNLRLINMSLNLMTNLLSLMTEF